jgi:predicted RNA-binding Zn ribbon-like protein
LFFGDYADSVTTLAEDVVNSYRHSIAHDDLTRPLLDEIARDRGWQGANATERDVAAVRALRPALREIFEHRSVTTANALLASSRLVPELVRHDGEPWHLHLNRADASLPEWVAGNAAFALLAVVEKGDINRLRKCVGPDCQAVFVDLSRNQSRRFCSPAVCGNRVHVAAHRARGQHTAM